MNTFLVLLLKFTGSARLRKWLVNRRVDYSNSIGFPIEHRNLDKRKYLTYSGIKNWDELTEYDKYILCIQE